MARVGQNDMRRGARLAYTVQLFQEVKECLARQVLENVRRYRFVDRVVIPRPPFNPQVDNDIGVFFWLGIDIDKTWRP